MCYVCHTEKCIVVFQVHVTGIDFVLLAGVYTGEDWNELHSLNMGTMELLDLQSYCLTNYGRVDSRIRISVSVMERSSPSSVSALSMNTVVLMR